MSYSQLQTLRQTNTHLQLSASEEIRRVLSVDLLPARQQFAPISESARPCHHKRIKLTVCNKNNTKQTNKQTNTHTLSSPVDQSCRLSIILRMS